MDWEDFIEEESKKPYFKKLQSTIEKDEESFPIYPSKENRFKAFELCPFDKTKVVILGQDPYHTKGVATGLAFGTHPDAKIPPSLRNIYKELENEGFTPPLNGDLSCWARQGVLLLNSILTVRKGQPLSHRSIGWETFTNKVLQVLSFDEVPKIFILWGAQAQLKAGLIDTSIHLILKSAHPSPLSANKGFFGNNHFRKANEFLYANRDSTIYW